MEVKTSGDAVDVEAFAGEVEARHFAALHGAEVDFLETHAAAGNELVLADDTATYICGFVTCIFLGFRNCRTSVSLVYLIDDICLWH